MVLLQITIHQYTLHTIHTIHPIYITHNIHRTQYTLHTIYIIHHTHHTRNTTTADADHHTGVVLAQITHRSQYALGRPLPKVGTALPPCVVPDPVQDLHLDLARLTKMWSCGPSCGPVIKHESKLSRETGTSTEHSQGNTLKFIKASAG